MLSATLPPRRQPLACNPHKSTEPQGGKEGANDEYKQCDCTCKWYVAQTANDRDREYSKGKEGTPDDAVQVGSPNIPWLLWTTCVGTANVTDESRASESGGGVGGEGDKPTGMTTTKIILHDTGNKEISDISNVSAAVGKARDALLGQIANQVFRYKPFIVLEEELEIDQPVAKMFFKEANLDEDNDKNIQDRKDLWINKNYKNILRQKHMKRRNNIHRAFVKVMTSKCNKEDLICIPLLSTLTMFPFWNTALMKNELLQYDTEKEKRRIESLPKYKEINIGNIRNENDEENYFHFMDHYGPKLVGHKYHEGQCTLVKPEVWMKPTEEAFGLLTLENYHNQVFELVKNNKKVNSKWTSERKAVRNQGYDKEGIERFGELYEMVVGKRGAANGGNLGAKYLQRKKDELNERRDKGKKRKQDQIKNRQDGWKKAAMMEIPV